MHAARIDRFRKKSRPCRARELELARRNIYPTKLGGFEPLSFILPHSESWGDSDRRLKRIRENSEKNKKRAYA